MDAFHKLILQEEEEDKMMYSCPVLPTTIPVVKDLYGSHFIKDLKDALSILYSSQRSFCNLRCYTNRLRGIDILELQFLKPDLRQAFMEGREAHNDEFHPYRELWEIYRERENYLSIYILVNNKTHECIVVYEYENLITLFSAKHMPENVVIVSEKMKLQQKCRKEINIVINLVREFYSQYFSI
jgi:hypothetical protein